ncbi:ligand-binding sensor domain-containing protein/signal transduction histidine kinase/DNA-binding response OmpR family regulator [Parabacteroides sp. PF5-5]|uniref:two-component regulator propeller domain-containing protein n=1 Tax=unclassified Parabacteroides TaxID=2649774 RepID=UPI002474E469|nr:MULTISPECIES: two-component regulator propeller domain-containing protein [unclassified Parabacteroides]MDH6304196.1 ligand-binding sensor domain-containing protein/signal transduction histidine kinase/DNA-binding response OmpR family regulator [Parabacteroides sp. PH5-39]MDH6315088.1 ligand-binding sensor domain-containing protein/signal transduction histidine kinase/DNA-binding response OmpR family regulator [Parabacteroides sp. PF5-13]MDH6318749.1 ligand-binding sensor domain-containing pr
MKTQHFRIICLFVCISFFAVKAYAERFRFRHYEVENGLPSNTVRSLTQDKCGFLWFGTENGLSRFDGYTFRNFRHIPNDSSSLGSNYIYSLYEDHDKKLWIGTDDGIYIYLPEMEKFQAFDEKTADGIRIRSHVAAIRQDADGNIWFATLTQGMFRYNQPSGKLFQYLSSDPSGKTDNMEMMLEMYIDPGNVVWASPQRNNKVLFRYDAATDRFVSLSIKINEAQSNNFGIYAMLEDLKGDFWIGTWNQGVCRLDRESGTIESYLAPGMPNGISHIHSLTEYQPGILLIGSDDGLSIFNTETYESELMTSSELKNSSLSDKFVYPVFKDKEGGLWVGTYYGGINYAPPKKGNIEGYAHSKYGNSIGGNIISCFCEDPSGKIWIGSDDGGLSLFDPKQKTFVNYTSQKGHNSLSYHNIHALCLDDNKLWIGTYSGGLNVLDLKTNRFSQYYPKAGDPSSLYGNSIYAIYKDTDNNLWIGTMEGICLYDRENDNFIRMREIGTTTVDITDSRDGNIWFSSWGKGVYRYNKLDKSWYHYYHIPTDPTSIPNNQVNSFHFDENGKLWLGTDNGLAVYEKESNSFQKTPLNIDNQLIYFVKNIDGNIWLTTPHGLVRYSLSDKEIQTFYKNDGLQSDQFNVASGLLSSTSSLYLGTTNGFNIIRPDDISGNHFVPPVYITNIQVFNKDIPIGEKSILNRSSLYTDEIELSHKESVLSIEYVALGYSAPNKNQFKYKLEGFDKDWNIIGNQRKATYTNLPAGKYLFRVAGSNSDGKWNEQEATLSVTIRPPFWLTPLAYLLYAAIIMGISGCAIYMMRRRTEIKHKRRIAKLKHDKEKELHEAKINFFTLVAHEIRTPVSLIIGPLEKIMDAAATMPQAMQDSLKIIDRNSQRLLSLVNQLLDFRKAEEGAFVIRFARHSVYELLQNVYIRFKPLAEQKDISLNLEMEDHSITATIDGEAVTKIVSNLLTNAIKHARSRIVISCNTENDYLIIKILDNGEGILPEEYKNIFRPFYQVAQTPKPGTGIGLSLVKLLADAHKGTIEVESVPGEETVFTLTLPLVQQGVSTPEGEQKEILSDEEPYLKKPLALKGNEPVSDKPLLLIVEDNSDMRKFLTESLHTRYKVIEARNGKQGLEQLRKQAVDIIISDIMMPIMDGESFTREVKENLEFSHIPLILLTAKTDKASKLSGMQSGADAYMEKPFSPQLLLAQIENLLRSRRELRKKFSEMPFTPLHSVAGNKADEQFLDRMNKIIDKNIANTDFSVDILAEQLHISRSGLFAKVKSLAGMTPNELIQLIRLKKAATLISEGQFRINEICYQVGFNNPSYFSKCFQKQFGLLPKEFQNKNTR